MGWVVGGVVDLVVYVVEFVDCGLFGGEYFVEDVGC